MQFIDLTTQYKLIKPEINKAIQKVLNSGQFVLGEQVEKFEQEIAQYLGAKYAIGVASGTDALLLSLMALDIGQGDEVITTSFTFIATASVIAQVGAKPVFVDIESKTFNIDASKIIITQKTKAIIPVHLYGQTADMDEIKKFLPAGRHGKIPIIEDACQAIDAEYKNKKAGTVGDLGCFSFFPTKNLGAYGDGGLVVTNSKQLAEKIKMLRAHGAKQKYYHQVIGLNSRLDELQAAILRVKLKYLDAWNNQRIKNAKKYNKLLSKFVITPDYQKGHVYHQYTIRVKNRDKLKAYLEKHNIPTAIYYPVPLHLQKCFKYLGHKKGDFPEAEKAAREVLSLPIFPELKKEEQDLVIEKIKEFYGSK